MGAAYWQARYGDNDNDNASNLAASVAAGHAMTIKGMLVLTGCFLLGAAINHYAIPGIPAAVIGILLLTMVLVALGEVPDYLSRTATTLLPYLPLMLVVPAAGIASAAHLPATEWLALLAAISLSLLVTVPFCGWLLQRLIRKRASR